MKQPNFPGDELRARREALGLSVEDAHKKLRIPIAFIEDIEAGNLENLPPLTYSVGFLSTYCRCLELPGTPFVDCLKECGKPSSGLLARLTGGDSPKRQEPWLRDLAAWLAISALLILGWVTYSVVVQPKGEATEGRVQAETVERDAFVSE